MTERSAAIIHQIYPALIVFFRSHLSAAQRDAAYDLAQETVIRAIRALDPGLERNEISNASAYIRGIARNILADFIGQGYQTPPHTPIEDVPEVELAGDLRRVASEERLLERERQIAVRESLRELPAAERNLLLLRYVEGLGNSEAARRLGMTSENASRLKYRAIETLRARVNDRLGLVERRQKR